MASPMLNENTFEGRSFAASGGAMTVQGAINKSVLLFALLVRAGC